MEAEEILTLAKASQEPPAGWVVLPLLRKKLIVAMAGWTFGIIFGFGLFFALLMVVIPFNYQHGFLPAFITTLLLVILLFIALGSTWTLINDIQRLRQIDKHLLVITPEDFAKQEGDKIIHVPLVYVRYVTARGLPPPEQTPRGNVVRDLPGKGENMVGFLLGRGLVPSGNRMKRKRMRTPTTLAFLDTRTDTEVIVANDASYGDPFKIAAILKQYVASAQQLVR